MCAVFGRGRGTPRASSFDVGSLDGTDGSTVWGVGVDDRFGAAAGCGGDVNGGGVGGGVGGFVVSGTGFASANGGVRLMSGRGE